MTAPPFNQRLSYRLGQPVWVEDEHLDLEHHFRFEALPTPGVFGSCCRSYRRSIRT